MFTLIDLYKDRPNLLDCEYIMQTCHVHQTSSPVIYANKKLKHIFKSCATIHSMPAIHYAQTTAKKIVKNLAKNDKPHITTNQSLYTIHSLSEF